MEVLRMAKATKFLLMTIVALLLLVPFGSVSAAPQIRLTIVIGQQGPGAPVFQFAEGLPRLISRNIPNVEATFQGLPAGVLELQLIGAKRADLALVLANQALRAFRGEEEFTGSPIPAYALTPLHNAIYQLVTLEGTGISTISDLRGKRVAIRQPGGPPEPERQVVRILQEAGINPDQDIRKELLGLADAVTALRDKRIDAIFWRGESLPTPDVLALATTPGVRIKLIPLDSVLPALQKKFGNLLFKVTILKEFYPGITANVPTVGQAILLVVHQDFDADLAYQITKLIYEKRAELALLHKVAQDITLIGVAGRSPIPFHPGAIRYFRERGVEGF
jgi:TRAP transporter TAXI family solute receptor